MQIEGGVRQRGQFHAALGRGRFEGVGGGSGRRKRKHTEGQTGAIVRLSKGKEGRLARAVAGGGRYVVRCGVVCLRRLNVKHIRERDWCVRGRERVCVRVCVCVCL